MTFLATLLAEDPPQQPQSNPLSMLLPMIPIVLLFYFLIMRPMKKKEADKQKNLLSSLKKNDRILTIGGIYGTLVSVSEKEDEIVLKVDDNTRIKMMKGAISRNLTNEEDAVKATEEAKKAKEAGKS